MDTSFFITHDGVWFQPTDACRGPWDPSACHAGPPSGLLARASVSRWEPTGAGMSDSLLFDEFGAVGKALQTILIRRTD